MDDYVLFSGSCLYGSFGGSLHGSARSGVNWSSCGSRSAEALLALAGSGECREDRQNADDTCESPCGFLDEVIGVAHAKHLIAAGKARRQTAALGFLDENNGYKKNCDQYGQYDD